MPVDWGRLRRLADRQADLLTRSQCRSAGLSEAALKWRVSSGRWTRVHGGVFLTRPGRADWLVEATGALLRVDDAGPAAQAAFCGRSAAHLWGLEARPPSSLELVVPRARCVTPPEQASVRRSARWDDLIDDRAYPWRTTRPATVIEVAALGSATDALCVVARAVQQEFVTAAELRQELSARRATRHGSLLADVLGDVDSGGQSGAELLYVRDVERAHGLPAGARQQVTDQGRRRHHDTGYEEYRLIVEVDGRLGHERWADRVRDGQRDRQVLTGDVVTSRVFWSDVALTPCQTAAEVGAVLRARGWEGAPRPCRRRDCTLRPGSTGGSWRS